MKTRFGILALGLVFMFCSACGNGGASRRPGLQNPVGPPQEYPQETSGANNPGSLFAASDGDTLFSDARARRVGDIVVVKLVENTKAQNKVETTADKDSNNNYAVNAFFNVPKIAGVVPVGTPTLNTNSVSDLSGTGKTKRENYVTTSMAVMRDRLPKEIYQKVQETIRENKKLDLAVADVVANAMKDWAVEKRGNDYLLVYNYSGKPMSIDLTKISGAKKNVWWMNPADGKLTYLGEYYSKVVEFTYDAAYLRGSDRVLIAVDSSKNYIGKTDVMLKEKN